MITQSVLWRQTDLRLRARATRSYAQARKMFEQLYQEARRLNVLPSRDPLEGLAVDIRLAAALNHLRCR